MKLQLVRNYISSKDGLTIISVGSFEDTLAQQRLLDNYLKYLTQKVYRKDKDLKMLFLLGPYGIHTPKRNFIGVSYNTFSAGDTVFIDNQFLEKYKEIYRLPISQNWLFNEMYPYEIISSIFSSSNNEKGLIIRFYGEFDSTKNYYDRILSIANYAISNIERIKEKQQYVRLPYHMKGMTISVLTFDTSKLSAIPIESLGYNPQSLAYNYNGRKLVILIVVASIGLLIAILLIRRRLFTKKYFL